MSKKKKIKQQNKTLKSQKTTKSKFPSIALAALVLLILTAMAYSPALDNDFVNWDDFAYVKNNPLVTNDDVELSEIFTTVVSLNYHPLTILTMRWNYKTCNSCLHGASAQPFILWNVILHIANSLLVLLLVYRLTKKKLLVAVGVAAVFALHPMHVESVAWVSERKDVLYSFFLLLGLLSYDRYLDGRYREELKINLNWLALALICFLLACLSKAMAVVFPLLMLLLDFWRGDDKPLVALKNCFKVRKLLEISPFLGLSVLFGMIAMNVQGGGDFYGMLQQTSDAVALNDFDNFTLWERLTFAAYGFMHYIYKFFLPLELSAFYPYPTRAEYDSSFLYPLLFVGMLIILLSAILSMLKTKLVAFSIAFYFLTVALVLQFISVGMVISADRYTYLPYIGLAFLLFMGVEKLNKKEWKYATYGILGLGICALGFKTYQQVDLWQDSDRLWTNVAKLYPEERHTYAIRANHYGFMTSYYQQQNQREKSKIYQDKAFEDFKKAIELGVERADVFEGIGNIYSMNGNFQAALNAYSKALELDPNLARVYANRGITYNNLGDKQKALADMEKAASLEPSVVHLLYRGIARQEVGDIEGAKADYRAVLELKSDHPQAAQLLNQLGG
jgi:Tfp pilus assembly protein PilF